MATYAIGDIHGCFAQLQELLAKIKFDPNSDTLWFTGDLINGGPQPAEVLRFIKDLGNKHVCVLGNHDLVLLAMAAGKITPMNDRVIGFEPVFAAPDYPELLEWLRMRPFVHYDAKFNALLVHAGVLPSWDLHQIQNYARELEMVLHGSDYLALYNNIFGDEPDTWDESLTGWPRLRFLANCFVRMRFCTANGKLELSSKGNSSDAPHGYTPWFTFARKDNLRIIFGHWSALLGKTNVANAIAMDTGCVWGNYLSALCLENNELFSVKGLHPTS